MKLMLELDELEIKEIIQTIEALKTQVNFMMQSIEELQNAIEETRVAS
jgi:hypothetical protein